MEDPRLQSSRWKTAGLAPGGACNEVAASTAGLCLQRSLPEQGLFVLDLCMLQVFLAPLPLGLLLATASVFEAEGPTKQLPDSLPI